MKPSPRTLVSYVIFVFLFTAAALFIGRTAMENTRRLAQTSARSGQSGQSAEELSIRFVIDPGHGGEDGGACVGDTLEKNLNLKIAGCLSDVCTVFGCRAKMTRTEDSMLYNYFGDLDDYAGKKKTYDLRNRLRIAEESGASLFISVHMNKFPQTQYHGLQVYYSPNTDASRRAAGLIQSYARKCVEPSNEREIKQANHAIYLLNRMKALPGVLVECGFLSNPEDREKLQTPSCQIRLAAVLFAAASEFVCTEQ